MDRVSPDSVVQDALQASSQLQEARDVSQMHLQWQGIWKKNIQRNADELTLYDGVGTLTPNEHRLRRAFLQHTYLSQTAHDFPADEVSRNVAVLREHLEDRPSTDVSTDGYILEPESSYQTLLDSDAELQKMQRTRRNNYKLEGLREDAEGMRLKVREARTALRRDRAALRDLEAVTMDRLQIAVSEHNEEAIVRGQQELAKLKDSRDDMNEREDDYNALEDHLLSGEWEVRQAEANMYGDDPETYASSQYRKNPVAIISQNETSGTRHTGTDIGSGLLLATVSTHIAPTRRVSAASQLTVVLASISEVKAELYEIRRERQLLLQEETSRARVGRKLDSESMKALDDFVSIEQSLLDKLMALEDDEAHLHPIVADQNETLFRAEIFVGHGEETALDSIGDIDNDLSQLDVTITDDQVNALDELLKTGTMDSNYLPLGYLFYSPYDTLSKIDSINDWLLQVLRSSKSEVQRLIFGVQLPDLFQNLSFSQVRQLLMDSWFRQITDTASGDLAADIISEEPSADTIYNAISIVTPIQQTSVKPKMGSLTSGTRSTSSFGYYGSLPQSTNTPSTHAAADLGENSSGASPGNTIMIQLQQLALARPISAAGSNERSSQSEPPDIDVNTYAIANGYRFPVRRRSRSIPHQINRLPPATRSLS